MLARTSHRQPTRSVDKFPDRRQASADRSIRQVVCQIDQFGRGGRMAQQGITKQSSGDRLWSSTELAEYLGVPPRTTDNWASSGIGPRYFKVGRHRRYHPGDVRAWL